MYFVLGNYAGSRPNEVIVNPSSSLQEFTQPLTEMSIKHIFLGSRVLTVRKADYLTAICEPIV
jgi:hypothetical protein